MSGIPVTEDIELMCRDAQKEIEAQGFKSEEATWIIHELGLEQIKMLAEAAVSVEVKRDPSGHILILSLREKSKAKSFVFMEDLRRPRRLN